MERYRICEMMQEGIKVVLEIPERSDEDEKRKRDAQKILTAALHERLQKYFSERDGR